MWCKYYYINVYELILVCPWNRNMCVFLETTYCITTKLNGLFEFDLCSQFWNEKANIHIQALDMPWLARYSKSEHRYTKYSNQKSCSFHLFLYGCSKPQRPHKFFENSEFRLNTQIKRVHYKRTFKQWLITLGLCS